MSMVSYYPTAAMYRHQHQAAAAAAQTGAAFHHHAANSMHPHSWYPGGYHHQTSAQVAGAPTAPSYCMQDEQQMWHSAHHSAVAAAFHSDFGSHEFTHTHTGHAGMPHHHQQLDLPENQLPSPPITVSGSELSSPGGAGGSVTPPNPSAKTRPAPARSPYDWMNKPSYQSQPNPESMKPLLLEHIVGHDLPIADDVSENGKTRTKDKYRVVYSDHQRVELEKEFYYSRYITIRRKAELATNLGLSERQVKIWFQNRRAKERKQVKKRDEFPTDVNNVNNSLPGILPSSSTATKTHLIQFTNHDLQHHFPFTEITSSGLMIDGQYNHNLHVDGTGLHPVIAGVSGLAELYDNQDDEQEHEHAADDLKSTAGEQLNGGNCADEN